MCILLYKINLFKKIASLLIKNLSLSITIFSNSVYYENYIKIQKTGQMQKFKNLLKLNYFKNCSIKFFKLFFI